MGRSLHDDPLRPSQDHTETERSLPNNPAQDREQNGKSIYEHRGQRYRVNSEQAKVLQDVGAFRTVTANSLRKHLYENNGERFRRELRNLAEQRLVRIQPGSKANGGYVSLTRTGRELTEASLRSNRNQVIYSGIVKMRELRHDAAIYDVYQKEAKKIAKAGGTSKRIVLDFELKKEVNRQLAKIQDSSPAERERQRREITEAHGLTIVEGRVQFPDVRIEFETRDPRPGAIKSGSRMRDRPLQSPTDCSQEGSRIQALQPGPSRTVSRTGRRPCWRGDVVMKSKPDAIAALTEFGYTAREAEFLCIVAAHSGFFLQRQFMQFVDVAGRGPATYFLKKALEKKHVREHLPERGTQKVYHLFSRTIYAALAKENSRHRRSGRYGLLEKAAVRITGLDFVLAHLDQHYLEEESDKVTYFTETHAVPIEALPAKVFRGQHGRETRHCLVENFPLSVSRTAALDMANFTYIEDEIRSVQTFSSFVQRYRPLFEALGNKFKLTFVSTSTRSFSSARDAFIRILSEDKRHSGQRQLARFFWPRRMAEEKRFKELNQKDVIDWQRGLKDYSDTQYETEYQDWKQNRTLPQIESKSAIHNPGTQFDTFLVVPNVGRFSPDAVETAAQPSAQLHAQRQGT